MAVLVMPKFSPDQRLGMVPLAMSEVSELSTWSSKFPYDRSGVAGLLAVVTPPNVQWKMVLRDCDLLGCKSSSRECLSSSRSREQTAKGVSNASDSATPLRWSGHD